MSHESPFLLMHGFIHANDLESLFQACMVQVSTLCLQRPFQTAPKRSGTESVEF